jgi:hypothetical protein
LLFYFQVEHFIESISICLSYKVAWFRHIATYLRHYVKVPPKSKCRTQACTTGLLKYIPILIQYSYNYNTIGSACKPNPETLAPLRRREPSSLASNLTSLVRSLSSSSAPKSKSLSPSLSTGTKVSVQQAAWSRHLQLPQHPLKCLLMERHSRKGPRPGFVRH